MTARPAVIELTADATHPLRRSVLRTGTASADVEFDGDDLPDTLHLGIELDGALVAISTWLVRRHPDHPALDGVQLRGMATAPEHRGAGLGARLLATGIDRSVEHGAELVWARARDTAIDFYLRRGFAVHGQGYVDLATGLPHHDVVLRLTDDTGDTDASATGGA